MSKAMGTIALIVFCALIIAAPPARADWVNSGIAICAAVENQTTPQIISDGLGGAIITWVDTRRFGGSGCGDIYAQKVNASGVVQWTADGVVIRACNDGSRDPQIASDGAGGAIISWVDFSAMEPDIFAARVNASGTVLWMGAICWANWNQWHPQIISDGSGGAIITWDDERSMIGEDPLGADIYAQRVNASGAFQWTSNGAALCARPGGQTIPVLAPDGSGGAIVAWQDSRNGTSNNDIFAQRINASGDVQWAENGIAISSAAGDQVIPQIVSDGSGGAIVTWVDGGTYGNIYAQKVDASGVVQWTTNGVVVRACGDGSTDPQIASDGAGGAIIAWVDFSGMEPDILAGRVNASGTVLWMAGICGAHWTQWHPQIISDGSGGAIVTWDDDRSAITEDPTSDDIYAQRVNASGICQWTWNGVALCVLLGRQTIPVLAPDGSGGAIVAWQDSRNGTSNNDIYAQNINGTGTGAPEPCAAGYLRQNYPNPFNPTTRLEFGLEQPGHVMLLIHDVAGRLVRVLVDEPRPAGNYSEIWDGRDKRGNAVASGIYFCRIDAGTFTQTRKMVLLK